MRALTKLNDGIQRLFMILSVTMLVSFASIVFLQIIFRNIFNIPMMWSIEVSLLLFFWSVFLGGAVGLRQRRHYTVELLPDTFVRTNLILDIISHIIVFFILYIFVVYGYKYAAMGFNKLSTSIAMPQGYFFLSLPVGAVAMILFSIELFIKDVLRLKNMGKEGIE